MSVPTREQVEQRVLRDARPDTRVVIQRATDRYRRYRSELVCVLTMQELIGELEQVMMFFYHCYAQADGDLADRWHREWLYLRSYVTQLKSMYL